MMTRKEFEHLSKEIQNQKFQCVTANPLSYAVERAKFRQEQFKKLIAAGRKVKGSRTVSAKVARFERSLKRLELVPARFRKLIQGTTPDTLGTSSIAQLAGERVDRRQAGYGKEG